MHAKAISEKGSCQFEGEWGVIQGKILETIGSAWYHGAPDVREVGYLCPPPAQAWKVPSDSSIIFKK